MINRTSLRVALGFIFAVSALGVVAAPAAAEVIIKQCVGTCGYYEITDTDSQPGAKCTYQNSYPYKLTSVNVRPPLMHGYYSTKTKVGWRFKIQRMNVNGGKWLVYYTSSYQTYTASDSIPAYLNHGFSRRTWNAPSNPGNYDYRVILELQWWKSGSVEGYAKIRGFYYTQTRANGSNSDTSNLYCIPND